MHMGICRFIDIMDKHNAHTWYIYIYIILKINLYNEMSLVWTVNMKCYFNIREPIKDIILIIKKKNRDSISIIVYLFSLLSYIVIFSLSKI